MNNTELSAQQDIAIKEFANDTVAIGKQTEEFLNLVYPAYIVDSYNLEQHFDSDSTLQLDGMTYFRISSCSAETVDKAFEVINEKIEKLFTALHSIGVSIGYGLVSRDGVTNLVLGIYSCSDVDSVKSITQGMLSGIEMDSYIPNFSGEKNSNMSFGILSGVPSLYLRDQKQTFSLSSIMRSLNGHDYTVMFLAKPVPMHRVTQDISSLITVRDKAFAVSKRNVSRSSSYSETNSHTTNVSDGKNSVAGQVAAGIGAAAGGMIGSIIPGAGTAAGALVGGGLGTIIGSVLGSGKTHSEGYSDSVSKAITNGESISGDIQNGFALELINYADKAIERLKSGQNNGIWQTAITYSADSDVSKNIIKACLCGELSKPDPDKLPLLAFEPSSSSQEVLRIPNFLGNDIKNPLCSYINSSELGLLCTMPTESVPDFELRIEKTYPLSRSSLELNSIKVGNVADGRKAIKNMPFALSELDLNKHTFVCGITGSGKTTTVKKILLEAQKPFLVIESAKKEYRNLAIDSVVYTLGKPELNCPQINPFYIMPGVSPQTHIDYLKDLFNASFSFYGPMPYILEKCLHTIYKNKGWDLTLGYHPMLVNNQSEVDFFNIEYTKIKYSLASHKYLFPTMQELKDEIARYIEDELKYDGEVAGNVKTAIKVRLENLCIGAKGFTFNTSEYLDFSELLEKNVVFELEGLADDSDKAFSVGLLVIFINEYRQIAKEIGGNKNTELKHLLVIEEAHRLLKNVDTERSTETAGNPKGKAVEHFTNMIAEMRSYGQGVIVAEQIPSKLAPDVIKNSSTKIVQRIVSADDQQIIANTIGISAEDALQLGSLEAGYAFCHKEGMSLPTTVKISDKVTGDDGSEQELDVFVSDEGLYNKNNERFYNINISTIRNALGSDDIAKRKILSLMNTLFIESADIGVSSCNDIRKQFNSILVQKGVSLVLCRDSMQIVADYMADVMLGMIVRGVYCANDLPADELIFELKDALSLPTVEKIYKVKERLSKLYNQDTAKFAKQNIVLLLKRSLKSTTDIRASANEYFSQVTPNTLNEIVVAVKGDCTV
ncbi:ATP-binding protein [Pseudoalteromonas prydzensis]|uniref:ATP-binding protein n=1 Tax=Pseudoalteromonas prydzensis TaxID=182141 RepID=UPI0024BCFDA2|nr:ATP-binding protein [Pseudoalteromonas prydzensis]